MPLRSSSEVTEARFGQVVRLIERAVSKYRRKYLLPRDEAWSAAGLAFANAHRSYRRRHGKFSTWVCQEVEYRLMDLVRERARETQRRVLTSLDLHLVPADDATPMFDPEPVFERVSRDGRVAVEMVLDPPSPVRLAVRGRKSAVRAMRAAVRRQLKDSGWSESRIKRAFWSVRRGL